MGFWDTVFKVGKEVISTASEHASEVTDEVKRLRGKSDKELLDIANKPAWKAKGKEQSIAKSMLRKRGYSEREINYKNYHT
ncbi:hypothetical protein [Idiomarina sp. OXR-189]|mgnify:CR=1 FL=1|uniref:hypothetical protein n=1 Tax=Idiomarina sp. OXR-189 TaxID=3100175 RepID=UPI002AC9E3BA|nr:hypothetical protein [Idiomarina sp. OXR-189]WPZ00151.1 hypothetical protein UM402_06485 [Idiomarina sp. OXR-189]